MPPPKRSSLPPRSGDIFVNRDGPLKIFEDAAFTIPDDKSILRVFHGVGGQGKTALCRKTHALTGSDPTYSFLKRGLVDLHRKEKTDPDLLLVWIRNEFAKDSMAFPTFDIALALMWETSRGEQTFPKLENAWLSKSSETLSQAAPDVVQTIREVAEQTVETIPLLGILATKGSKWVMDKSKNAYLHQTREHLKELYRDGEIKKPHEISELLPWMLAQDFNYHLEHNSDHRFALFMDEYERVFPEGGTGAYWRENPFDQHMRTLVQETSGLLVVFFTRRKLLWDDIPDWREDLKDAQHPVIGLAKEHADEWLRQIPIAEKAIREAIIEGAREDVSVGAKIYPLMLDLQIEHWRKLTAKGADIVPDLFHVSATTFEDRCIELIERLFRDYGEPLQLTLQHLCVAKKFDRTTFEFVINHFGTALPLERFDRLIDFSFISESEDGSLVLHRAVAEAVCTMLGEEKLEISATALLEHYEGRAAVPSSRDVSDETVAMFLQATYLRQMLGAKGYVTWLDHASEPIEQSARFVLAERVWREALLLVQKAIGAENPDTATCYNNVATHLANQGRFCEAGRLYEKAVKTGEVAQGAEHPDTVSSYNNLAINYNDRGHFSEAELLNRKVLEIRKRLYGKKSLDTANSYNSLAFDLDAQGHFEEAELLYRKALKINVKLLGKKHIETANIYNNMAANLSNMGRNTEAKPLFRMALKIRKKLLGKEHPDTATGYNNVASNFHELGRFDKAELLYRKALEIFEKMQGEEHPSTAHCYTNLASVLEDLDRFEEAEPLHRKALKIREKMLGEMHPDTANSYNNIARSIHDQGRFVEAERLYRKALEICEGAFGEKHPHTKLCRKNLAACIKDKGNHEN